MADITNALSFDIEDWFHADCFARYLPKNPKTPYVSRVEETTNTILDICREKGVHATFFVLGEVAKSHPGLVKKIARQGHEVASHGNAPERVYRLTPEEFRTDLRTSLDIIEKATGTRPIGYRAPAFSITKESFWAFREMKKEGIQFDSSIYPIKDARLGIENALRYPSKIDRVWEFPLTTLRVLWKNIPVCGGGYFRLFPYFLHEMGVRAMNQKGKPAILYLHPFEFDTKHPDVKMPTFEKLRRYGNISQTKARLEKMLDTFTFAPVGAVLGVNKGGA